MSDDFPTANELIQSIVPNNLMAQGGNISVYRINGNSDYVVGVLHRVKVNALTLSEPKIIEDEYQGKNFGQAVAEYGYGVALLKFQKGIAVGGTPRHLQGNYTQEENDIIYEQTTRNAANMPMSAYVELLYDLQFLNSIEKLIDPSKSNNLLMDMEAKKFNLVDINSPVGTTNKNEPCDLIMMLFDNMYSTFYQGDSKMLLEADRKVILDKMLSAAEHVGIKFTEGPAEENSFLSYSMTLAGYLEGSPERVALVKRIESIVEKPVIRNTKETEVPPLFEAAMKKYGNHWNWEPREVTGDEPVPLSTPQSVRKRVIES